MFSTEAKPKIRVKANSRLQLIPEGNYIVTITKVDNAIAPLKSKPGLFRLLLELKCDEYPNNKLFYYLSGYLPVVKFIGQIEPLIIGLKANIRIKHISFDSHTYYRIQKFEIREDSVRNNAEKLLFPQNFDT